MAKASAAKLTPVERKLVGVADTVIVAADKSRDPALSIPVRSLANVHFNAKRGIIEMGKRKQERTLFNVGMARKFMQTVLVADALAELQRANLTTSLREIYYRTKHTMKDSHENTFDTQNESDPLIEDLEVTLAALREELHVRAENAGSIVGPVVFEDDGDRVDCARLGKGGYSVPSIVEPEFIQIRKCTADFVLLVEKGTQWNRLSEDKFWRRYNCVLLTGNGQPPRGVRRLARRLNEEYDLPVYVLVDNDPWGYYIYSVVKQGSINLAFESERMAIPKAKFIGLSSADPDAYGLPRNVGSKTSTSGWTSPTIQRKLPLGPVGGRARSGQPCSATTKEEDTGERQNRVGRTFRDPGYAERFEGISPRCGMAGAGEAASRHPGLPAAGNGQARHGAHAPVPQRAGGAGHPGPEEGG